jgi:hypothetical protein
MEVDREYICCFCNLSFDKSSVTAMELEVRFLFADKGPDTPVQILYTHLACAKANLRNLAPEIIRPDTPPSAAFKL